MPINNDEQSVWSLLEHQATLDAYVWMLEKQIEGSKYVKREVIRKLQAGPLSNRTRQAIEYRFRNLSSVFIEHSMIYVRGYLPLEHIGPTGRALIEKMLDERDLSQFAEPDL